MPKIMKLHRYIDHDSKMTPIDFQVTRSKVKGRRISKQLSIKYTSSSWSDLIPAARKKHNQCPLLKDPHRLHSVDAVLQSGVETLPMSPLTGYPLVEQCTDDKTNLILA
ncbi:hypothetical protein DPMN_077915 [Dreissena polymorpha]|uniref:Uncharacterized protein n=1 Tax=Dreissena polymorpha TaxID=45954 RepID=A0A9D4BPR8_DREPO|nr:hypothetical protein DPMN_077915 [Dreissena polymorpha]